MYFFVQILFLCRVTKIKKITKIVNLQKKSAGNQPNPSYIFYCKHTFNKQKSTHAETQTKKNFYFC